MRYSISPNVVRCSASASGPLRCGDTARISGVLDYSRTGTGKQERRTRILAAVRAAGERGLSKWQITAWTCFNRHATKFEIDEALRLLKTLTWRDAKRESTATRPAERWFLQSSPPAKNAKKFYAREAGQSRDTSHSSHPQAFQKRKFWRPGPKALFSNEVDAFIPASEATGQEPMIV